jgi:hypothetical protein
MSLPALVVGAFLASTPGGEDDETLRAVWGALAADDRREVVEYLELDLSHAQTFQLALVRHVVGALGVEPGLLDAAPPPSWYDPAVHAPAQPIPRVLLAPDAPLLLAARRRMAASFPARPADPAFAYDFGTRTIVRVGERDDPTRRFEAALAGLPADHDLVTAAVLAAIDDGSQSAVLAAFGRLYTDRAGNVYPGITLYDAWASGASIEMPDVDTLGIVHTLADDWKRWKAPVPDRQHAALYGRIGEWFVPARHHRGLREALAATYLEGEPAYRDGYTSGNTVGFHVLWNRASSDPAVLQPLLPEAKDWAAFLEALNADLARDREAWAGGEVRRDTLRRDQAHVRARLVAVLVDLGHLAEEAPAPARDAARERTPEGSRGSAARHDVPRLEHRSRHVVPTETPPAARPLHPTTPS